MIALVDYGAGNMASVGGALATLGADVGVAASPGALGTASGVVIPGVGHFGVTATLDHAWRAAVMQAVDRGIPLLGICLGMQWLFDGSDEANGTPGLGLLPGRITRLRTDRARGIKVPHVGWNALGRHRPDTRLLARLSPGTHMYFAHAFAAPVTDACAATTTHADTFASAVEHGAIFGTQFHPEQSGLAGLQLLRNFLDVCRC